MVEEKLKEELSGISSLREWVFQNQMMVIGIVIVLLILKWRINDLRRRWFAAFMCWFTKNTAIKIKDMKQDIFSTLDSIVSYDPALRKTGGLKILEIGVGTGTNFEFYPNGTRLTVVDPNKHFEKYYRANRERFPNIQSEDIIIANGEDMDMIPDNCMDVVVVTLVFCSVENTAKVLKQILRVLVPGGKFYFYEHIQEFDKKNHNTKRRLQTFLTKTGIWPFFLDNCNLDRDMLKTLESTGFSKVQAQRFYSPINHPLLQILNPSLKGVAEK